MAEMLCCQNTPAVLSIGKRCPEMGYAFFRLPFSEHPFFINPDGTRTVMDVDGTIPYLAGGGEDTACPAEEDDGPGTDDEDTTMPEMPRDPVTVRRIWQRAPITTSVVQDDATPRDDNVVQDDVADDDATPRGNEPSGLDADAEVEEIESLPTGVIPPNDNDEDQDLPRVSGDLGAVYSRDFQDTLQDARSSHREALGRP
jgi:hypothetical protein